MRLAASTARSLPPCGGGLGRGVSRTFGACLLPPSLSLPLKGGEDARAASVCERCRANGRGVA